MPGEPAFHQQCQCHCGAAAFEVQRAPLMRFICHCTICQRFNGTPFADMVVLRSDGVVPPADGTVDFGTYRPPPAVQRGKCATCNKPAIEFMRLPLMPALTFVPAANFADAAALPAPRLHTFYDKRVVDIDDGLPKHRGYLKSQLAFARAFYPAWWRTRGVE